MNFTRLETEVSFWGQDAYVPTSIRREATGSGIERLVSRSPAHPDYLSLQAAQLSWEAYWAETEEARLDFYRRSFRSQQRALESRPVYPQSWAKMLEYASRTREGAGMIAFAQSRLAELSPDAD